MPCAISTGRGFLSPLGFTVGARNRHPWGTHNHIVQLPGFFIEILTLAEPDKLGDDGFSTMFGQFNGDFLKTQRGLFASAFSKAAMRRPTRKHFGERGSRLSAAMRFEREGKRPDGSAVKLAFSLVFARDPLAPQIRLCRLPASLPGEFLESGVSETCKRRDRSRRRCDCRRESDRSSHLHVGLHRRARFAVDIERDCDRDAARRNPGHGSDRLSQSHFGIEPPSAAAGMRLCAITVHGRPISTQSKQA